MITANEADQMYDQWRNSGSDQEFRDYFGLSIRDLAEIAKAYADKREDDPKSA